MKIEPVKSVFALGIALIVGFLCEILAPEVGDRNWISFVVATVSMLSMLFPAIGVSYANVRRGANVKVTAWIMAIALLIANVLFSFFEYKVDIYIIVCLAMMAVGGLISYSLVKQTKQ